MFHNKVDFVKTVLSAPRVITDILSAFIPYSVVVAGFAAFVVWNGGIVLGRHSPKGPQAVILIDFQGTNLTTYQPFISHKSTTL